MALRVRIVLLPEGEVFLPFNYNYEVSSLLYRILHDENPSLSEKTHEEKKAYFSFSNLIPHKKTARISEKGITFSGRTTLIVSTLSDEIGKALLAGFAEKRIFLRGWWNVEKLETQPFQRRGTYLFTTLSPILLRKKNGSTSEDITLSHPSFSSFLRDHLLAKYQQEGRAFGYPPVEKDHVTFRFLKGKEKRIAIKRDQTPIFFRVSEGRFFFHAPDPFISFFYYRGIGQLVSQGFGMIQELKCSR